MNVRPPNLDSVRLLTLKQIAQYWSHSIRMDEVDLLNELRQGVIGVPVFNSGEDLPEPILDTDHLPNELTRVNRRWISIFCEKQGWPLPEFWFPRARIVKAPGRPTIKHLVVELFQERNERGLTEPGIKAEARAIHGVLVASGIDERVPEPKTIEGHIRDEFNARR